jgi:hypothetical protein
MKANERQNELSVFYYPQSHCIEVQWDSPLIEIEIYDLYGVCALRLTGRINHLPINITHLVSNTYLVFVRDIDSNKYLVQKLNL